MKKSLSILFLFAFALGTLSLSAQRDYRFGINIIPALSWFGNESDQFSSGVAGRMGFGLVADIGMNDRISILTGVNYMARGASVENELTGFSQSIRANYVELPISLKMSTAQFDKMTYFAKFGTIIGFFANSLTTFDAKDPSILPSPMPDKSGRQTSFLTNIFQIGLGAEYELRGGTALIASIDYNLSYYNNVRKNRPVLFNDASLRFNHVALTIGIIF
jgi:hypothetical protein